MELLVNIDVDDLAKAIRFYCQGLGLKVGRRFGKAGVEMLGATCTLFLLVKEPNSKATGSARCKRDYRRHWTPVHLDFVVEEILIAVEGVQALGASLEGEVETHAWGHIAHMADPFGHGFCLIEFRGKGYDEVASELG